MSGWSAKTSAFLAGALHTYIVCSAYCCLYRCAHCKLVRNVASTLHSLKTNAGARSTLLSQIQVKAFGCELNF